MLRTLPAPAVAVYVGRRVDVAVGMIAAIPLVAAWRFGQRIRLAI